MDFCNAIDLNPQYSTALHWYAINHLAPTGMHLLLSNYKPKFTKPKSTMLLLSTNELGLLQKNTNKQKQT